MPSRRRRASYVGERGVHVDPRKLPSLCHLGQSIIGTTPAEQGARAEARSARAGTLET